MSSAKQMSGNESSEQCTGTTLQGLRCRKYPTKGYSTCCKHRSEKADEVPAKVTDRLNEDIFGKISDFLSFDDNINVGKTSKALNKGVEHYGKSRNSDLQATGVQRITTSAQLQNYLTSLRKTWNPNIKTLDLSMYADIVDDRHLKIVEGLTYLRELNLHGCRSITGAGFGCLSSLTALQDLNVRNTKINDEGLPVIDSLPAIHTLDLRGCGDVSAQAVASLSIPNVLADKY